MLAVSIRTGKSIHLVPFPWRISIVAFMANPLLIKDDAQAARETVEVLAKDPFFDVVELNLLGDEAWRSVEPLLKSSGLEVAAGLQPMTLAQGFNPSSVNEDERRRAVEALSQAIKTAASRGVRRVAFSSGADPGSGNREAAKDSLVKSLRELAGLGSKLGVEVILETFDRDWDKRQLIGPIREAVEVVSEVRQSFENVGLLWDLSHAPMLGEKPADLKLAKGLLSHIHIGCAKKLPDGKLVDWHPGFYRPGAVNGVEDVSDLLKVLAEIEYSGAVGFEVKPEEGQFWREVVESAKGVLYTAFARVVQ
ncbi:sugar phosphate isomerase/epimerase [Infirmifilum lucidum]|uniref:Sugar phosphate isomerase/epimerase n=1 Tax=Infirmifilum lucidum TaxID=2776706 RepID=A0A7L9FI57_9CREN|nr:sugar phosphate isomerase/epimerase family protein [Infirmifilum lucidum]QOJ79518.1 sugar phosphate isomerase/epimerase [Infirmifilum lucidum]